MKQIVKKTAFFIVLLTTFFIEANAKIIHITPGAFGDIFNTRVKIGNAQVSCYRLREALKPLGYSLQQGGSFVHLSNPEYIIFFDLSGNLNHLKRYPKEKRVLFLWEPPASLNSPLFSQQLHDSFGTIFTWDDRLIDNKKYFKFHYPQPTLTMITPKPFNEKKMCSLFACNKVRSHPDQLYGARKEALHFFEKLHPTEFDLYGIGWENSGYKTFRGYIFEKIDTLRKYRFNICYENTKNLPGYVTEKIFDCFVAGCIPIYLGADNITDYVPKECFIDRREFSSMQELYAFISTMSEEKYLSYITNIQNFLKSEKAWLFSSDSFIQNFISVLKLHA